MSDLFPTFSRPWALFGVCGFSRWGTVFLNLQFSPIMLEFKNVLKTVFYTSSVQQLDNIFYRGEKGAMNRKNLKKPQDRSPDGTTSKLYIEKIKRFLSDFKTKPCKQEYEHDSTFCFFYHGFDRRRNPYQGDSFLYYPVIKTQQEETDPNKQTDASFCLTQAEFQYHPITYKTNECVNFENCPFGLLCPSLHAEDYEHFSYGEFFRFDITTHKTKKCFRRGTSPLSKDHHERKTCIFFHNEMDRRRPNFSEYSHELCPLKKCQKKNCQYSHNKIEQVYHPTRYKSKFCQAYQNKKFKCEYKQFCAFAHAKSEIKIEMIHLLPRDHQFYLYKYKTVWCPDTQQHDRSTCVYAHNIQDFRRNPREFKYKPEKCPQWNFDDELKSLEESGCKAGMDCDKCHGWMEQRYHYQVYKKGKNPTTEIVNTMLEKKLNEKAKQPVNSKMYMMVEEKRLETSKPLPNQHVGLPFFKKELNLSESSRNTKAITTNIESDDSYLKEKVEEKEINPRKNNMFLFVQDLIWKTSEEDENNNEFEKKLNEERAKSESKFNDCETVYSRSLKETVGNSIILRKLKNNNINGVKIKNLSKDEINDFPFLSQKEKEILSQKVRLYHLKRERNPIMYSIQLSRFFIRRKREGLLEKLMRMKVKEEKLLSMRQKQVEKYDFLSAEEKAELPVLIENYKKFCNQKEFNQINQEIARFVSPGRGELGI